MADTGTSILALASTLTEGDTISSANGLIWINEFIRRLGVNAYSSDTEDYASSVAYTWYSLPTDFAKTYAVEAFSTTAMADADYMGAYKGFEIRKDKIRFLADGNFKLTYFKLPAQLSAIGDTFTPDAVFFEACALFVAYRYLTNDDEDNAKNGSLGVKREGEYYAAQQLAIGERRRLYPRTYRMRRQA